MHDRQLYLLLIHLDVLAVVLLLSRPHLVLCEDLFRPFLVPQLGEPLFIPVGKKCKTAIEKNIKFETVGRGMFYELSEIQKK